MSPSSLNGSNSHVSTKVGGSRANAVSDAINGAKSGLNTKSDILLASCIKRRDMDSSCKPKNIFTKYLEVTTRSSISGIHTMRGAPNSPKISDAV